MSTANITPTSKGTLMDALITTVDSRVTDDSTVTIDMTTVPLIARVPGAGRVAPARIMASIHAMGYRVDGDYYDVIDTTPDLVTIPVVRV